MNEITVNECYEIMKVGKIINIEDGIKFDSSVRAIVYDYLHIGEKCRNDLKDEIPTEIGITLSNLKDAMPRDYSWDSIPDRNAEALLLSDQRFDKALEYYRELEKMSITVCQGVFKKYGIGMKKSSAVLPELLIQEKDDGRIPLRIISDWNAEDIVFFDTEVRKAVSNKERFICIIDDQLNLEKYGEAIINHITTELNEASEYGTYLVLSSNGSRSLAKFDDKIYIDFIEKGGFNGNKDELLNNAMNAIIRSNYNMLLRIMQKRRIEAITGACHEALSKRETAVFLANMAKAEGETGYKVIEDWMSLRERYYFEKAFDDDIKTMTSLSWILSMSDELGYDTSGMWGDVEKLQEFEQFDYSINQKLLTIQPGDVFELSSNEEKQYYVLIGQTCDMMLRYKGNASIRTKNECCLLPASLLTNHYIPKTTQKVSEGKVVVNQFCVDGLRYSLCIDCQHEKMIDDMILDLCSFNLDGVAKIDLDQREISTQKRSLITDPMVGRYKNITEFFSLYNKKFDSDPSLKDIIQKLTPTEEKKLIPIYSFEKESNTISFTIRRICRIKKYVGLLNQLHSEYTNRLGFDTMNVDCVDTFPLFIQIRTEEAPRMIENVFFQLTTNRTKNIRDRQKLKWFVERAVFEKILDEVGMDKKPFNVLLNDDYYIFEKTTMGLNNSFKYTKKYDSNDFKHTLLIEVK